MTLYPQSAHRQAVDLLFVTINFIFSRVWNVKILYALENSELFSSAALCFNLVWILVTSEAMNVLSAYQHRYIAAKNESSILYRLSNRLFREAATSPQNLGYAVVHFAPPVLNKSETQSEEWCGFEILTCNASFTRLLHPCDSSKEGEQSGGDLRATEKAL